MKQLVTLAATLRTAEAAFARGDLEAALASIANQIANWLSVPDLTNNALWGSVELDTLLTRIGAAIHGDTPAALDWPGAYHSTGRPRDVYLFTRTEAGGHSRVAGDFVRAAPDHESVVVLSGQVDLPLPGYFPELVATPAERFVCLPAVSWLERTRSVAALLKRLQPDRVFIFNHHDDVATIAAASVCAARKLFYVHCCDFQPAVGVFLPQAIHVDITPRAWTFCRSVLGRRSEFVPLVAPDLGVRDDPPNDDLAAPCLATCGSPLKYDLGYRLPYHRVVAQLLASTNSKLYHIGYLHAEQLTRITNALQEAGVAEGRWINVPSVASVWRTLGELRVDLYINSFPQRGARVAVEVMGSGTPAGWHLTDPLHRHADLHLAYPDARSWSTPDELVEIVRGLTPEWIQAQRTAARSQYEQVHHPRHLEAALARDLENSPCPPLTEKRLFAYEFGHLQRSWHRLAELTARGTDAAEGP